MSTPIAYISSKVLNSLVKVEEMYQIAGLYDITVSADKKVMHFYGYNTEHCLGVWHKSFGTKIDSPCRLDSLFLKENGTITLSALHPSLPLFLTVSEQDNKGQMVLISYEQDKDFTHAGHYIPTNRIVQIHWLGHLPLFVTLDTGGAMKLIGPAIEPVMEDINSFTSMLSYSTNTHTPYLWKTYYSNNGKGFPLHTKGMLYVGTFHIATSDKYKGLMLLFGDDSMALLSITISNVLNQDDLDVQFKIKGKIALKPERLTAKYILKAPASTQDSFQICLQGETALLIYTSQPRGKRAEWNCERTGEIPFPTEVEVVRVNSHQMPLIAIMDRSKLIKMYNAAGKYLGYINLIEVHNSLLPSYSLDTKIKKVDFLFYHNTNIQALIVLFNQKMVLLCNNYRYEAALDFVAVDAFERPVPYELNIPFIELSQSSTDSIVLCTSKKAYLVRKEAVKVVKGREKHYQSIKGKLHSAHEMYPIYHPALLREYLTFGDMKTLSRILRVLYSELINRKETGSDEKVMMFLGITVDEILEKYTEQKIVPAEPVESTGNSIFDDIMFESTKPAVKIKQSAVEYNKQEEIEDLIKLKDELIEMIQDSPCIELNESERQELISFISNLKELLGYQKAEDEIAQEFLLHMNVSNVRWSLGQKVPISTMDVVLAYHCQNQDMILKAVLGPPGTYAWEDVKRFGIPLWLKDVNKLKEIVESVAKVEYQRSKEKDADRVGSVSLWYIMLRKKNVLSNLYRSTQQGRKIFEFLGHNFTEERWRKAAVRNAYQLFSQKRYVLAAAFYLIGGQINEATQVAITHLKDLYLAVTICRLMEAEGQEELMNLYKEYYIEKGTMYGDPWIVSFGHWLCGDCIDALNCIEDALSHEEPVIKDEIDPRLNVFCKEDSVRKRKLTEEWTFETPTLSTFNASMIVLCRKLEKHYLVRVVITKPHYR